MNEVIFDKTRQIYKWGDQSPENLEAIKSFYVLLKKFPVDNYIKEFLWKLSHKGLVLGEVRHRWNNDNDDKCQMCGIEVETYQHLFFNCDKLLDIKRWVSNTCNCTLRGDDGFLFINGDIKDEPNFFFNAIIKYAIWTLRNKIIFENGDPSPGNLIAILKNMLKKHLQIKWECCKNAHEKRNNFTMKYLNRNIVIEDEVVTFI